MENIINSIFKFGELIFHFGKILVIDDIKDYGKWHHDGAYGPFDMFHHWWIGEVIAELGATIGETAVYALTMIDEPENKIKSADELLKDYVKRSD